MLKRFCVFKNAKLLKKVLVWLLSIAIHKGVSVLVYNKGNDLHLDTLPPLYDIVQSYIPNLQPYRILPEFLHLIPIAIFFYLVFKHSNENSVNALQKMFHLHSELMLLRCICFSVTLLPDSSQMCKNTHFIGSCYDLIYSGHTTAMFLFTYLIREFYNVSNILYINLQLNNIITSILIIACRNHYTIDVIISLLATNYFYSRYNYRPVSVQYNTYL